jgi:hypothetical protein
MTQLAAALGRASSLVALSCLVLSLACGGDPVGPNGVAYIRLSGIPEGNRLYVGGFTTLVVDQYGPDDQIVPGSHDFLGGIPVSWTISDNNVAVLETFRRNGTVTALAPGSVVITATSDGKRASVRLEVIPTPS